MLRQTTADILHSYRGRGGHGIKELRQHRHDIRSEAQHLIGQYQQANRAPSAREEARLDELHTELQEAERAIEQVEADMDHERGLPLAGGADRTPGLTSGWRDAEGRPVAVLTPSQTLADHYRRSGRIHGQASGVGVGDFIAGIITGQWPHGTDMRASLAGGSDAAGGYLLDTQMSAQIIDLARNKSVLLQAGAQTVPMSTSELAVVKVTEDPDVTWTAENQPISITESAFGRLTFRARKLAAIVKLSAELVEDAPNASRTIEDQLSKQLALGIDYAGLRGSAAGEEPTGLFNHAGVQESDVAGGITYDEFLDAMELIENANGTANAMLYSPGSKNTLAKMKDSQGNYLSPPTDLQSLNRLVTKQLTDAQAALGDFTQVWLGVRMGVQIEASRVAGDAFRDDQVWIRARWRGDVQIARPEHLVRLINIT